jgi:flagellar biosynthetic protein FlhB
MSESSAEKKHAPTERRLREAGRRGDVRRSADFPKAAVIIAASAGALAAGAGIATSLSAHIASWLALAGTAKLGAASGWAGLTLGGLFPLLLGLAALGAAATLVNGGFVFALPLLKPDLTKLLPSHGLGEIFSPTGLTDTLKALIKFIIIAAVATAMILARLPQFAALAVLPVPAAGPLAALCLQILTGICAIILLLAGIDAAIAYWQQRQKLRMSDAEIREESKDAQGNPQIRQRQRQLARKLARARQMRAIPEASVIVTNPSHYACAIRYRRGADRAPVLLAKGVGLLASEIVARGRGHGIPVVEAPPLARAIYRHVEPGDQVPVALYRACAEVLAYVWKMQRWRAQGGQRPTAPRMPDKDIDIPRPWQ